MQNSKRLMGLPLLIAGLVAWPFSGGGVRGQEEPTEAPAEAPSAEPAEKVGGVGVIIPINGGGGITGITFTTIKRRVEEAREKGVKVIIFELDTPGGEVMATMDITALIKNMSDIKTVAWVNPKAISGGVMVAVSCDEIVMARASSMGDSQVIMGVPFGGAQAVPEELKAKVFTPVLKEFESSARQNGYSPVLCEAMVLPEREVWWIEHIETGKREFVFKEDKIKRVGDDPIALEDASPSDIATSPKWKLVESYLDIVKNEKIDLQQPVVRDNLLLQMSQSDAYAFGFSKGIIANESELMERYGLSSLERSTQTWSEGLAFWLTSIYVRGFLLILIFLGAYVEFNTPGVGVPGLTALVCLGIFVGAPYVTGLADVWEILLLVLGVALIAVEVFVIPGFGVAGISGLALLLTGLVFTFVPNEPGREFPLYIPSFPATVDALKMGMITVMSSLVMSVIGMFMVAKHLPSIPLLRAAISANPRPADVQVGDAYHGAAGVGEVGVAATALRPAGKAQFGSMLVDVVTEGGLVDEGASVAVVRRLGNQVVVRPVPQNT